MKIGPLDYKVTEAPPDLSEVVAKHPFLAGMTPAHLQILTEAAMLKDFKQNEIIFKEGDPANRFYLIRSGKVFLESRQEDEPEPRLLQYIGEGDALGWSWLFPPYYWHFDARTVEPTETIFFYGTRLREQCEQDPALGYELMRRMSQVVIQRLQTTRKKLLESERKQRVSVKS